MKLKKYFSTVVFVSTLMNNQMFFCSQKSSKPENDYVHNFVKDITSIFQKLLQPFGSVYDLNSLYDRYKVLIPNLERSLFDYVCNDFISKGNSSLIDQAFKQDTNSISSSFGLAVQESLTTCLNLYSSYQEKIGPFEKETFFGVFDKFRLVGKKDFLVDACNNDNVKITSFFGMRLKNVVMMLRRCKVIASLGQVLRTDAKKSLVFSVIAQQIHNEKKITNPHFFPELLSFAFEHVFNESKYSSSSIDDLVNLINKRHGDLVAAFIPLLPSKLECSIQIQKYIKPFCEALKNYAKKNRISELELNLYEPGFKKFFLQNLSKEELERMNTLFDSEKVDFSADAGMSEVLSVLTAQTKILDQEISKRNLIHSKECDGFEKFKALIGVDFKNTQQAMIHNQAEAALIETKNNEQRDFIAICSLFFYNWRQLLQNRFNVICSQKCFALLENSKREKLALDSRNSLEPIITKELNLRSLILNLQKEVAQRNSIDNQQVCDLKIVASKARSSLKKNQYKEQLCVMNRLIKLFTQKTKHFQKDLREICDQQLLLLNEKIDSNRFEKLKEELKDKKFVNSRFKLGLDPYSFSITNNPIEKNMYNFLGKIHLIEKREKLKVFIDSSQDRWYQTADYAWCNLRNGTRFCIHKDSRMLGLDLPGGRMYVKGFQDSHWKALN